MKLRPEQITGSFGEIGYFHLQGDGRPLLMFHASGAGNASLLRLAKLVQDRSARPIWSVALDGYSGSRIREGETALERHLTVVVEMLDHIGQPTDLFGHSVGGFTALNAAKQDHPLIASVTAVEPVAINTLREHGEDKVALDIDDDAVLKIAPAMAAGDPEAAVRDFITVWNGVNWIDMPVPAREAIVAMAPQILQDTNAIRFAGGFADDYRRVPCPVHLIGTGRSPETARSIIRRLKDACPEWRVSMIEDAGHMGPIEQPDLFAPLIS